MTDHHMTQTQCCNHYPNRVLQKTDVALEVGVCERTVTNLMHAGLLPEPTWLNSIPVWMLYDIHAFISAQAGKSRAGGAPKQSADRKRKNAKGTAHKAGKYSA
jgi:hypothetical protein